LTGLDEFIISRRRNSVVEVKRRLEREFFESEEKMKVGVSSVRIDRVQIGSNKDRQMKKSMISTPALLTEDFSIFLSHFLFVLFFTESFIQFVPHTQVRMYNTAAFSTLTRGIEEADPGATSGP
jgi:hypothetical protein